MANTTVGTAVIKLSFDGKGIKADIDGVTRDIETTGKNSGSRFGDAFTIAVGNVMAKGFSKIMSTITNQIDDAVLRADTLDRFPKVMEQMGYSAEEAEGAIKKLMKGVEQVPTPLNEVVSGTQRLVSVTHDVDKASDWIMAISDAMLANGASATRASDATEQFLQVVSRGKPMGQDWLTIMEVAPGVMDELAKSLGYTSATLGGDMYTALQKGELSMEDFMAKLVEMDKTGSGSLEALSEVARTATGGIETAITTMKQSVSNAIVEVIQEIGHENIENIITGIKDALVGLVHVIKDVSKFVIDNWNIIGPILGTLGGVAVTIWGINKAIKAFHAVQAGLNGIMGIFGKTLGGVEKGVGTLTAKMGGGALSGAVKNISNVFSGLGKTISSVLKSVGEGIAGFFSALANPSVIMGAVAFAAVAASIAAAIWLIGNAVGAIMPVLTNLLNNIIMPIAQFIANTVLSLIDALTQAVIQLTQGALIPLGEFMVNSFVTILQTVSDVITNLTQGAVIPLINTLSGAFVSVAQTIGDILTNVVKAALEGVANIVVAVGDGFTKMGNAIRTALEGVSGVINAFGDLIRSVADAAVAVVALVNGRSINYGPGYAHLFAEGGRVEGPGTSTSDSIPAMLSNGEYVLSAQAARSIGYGALDALNSGNGLWVSGLESGFEQDFSTGTGVGRGIVIEKQEFYINNEMDAQDIGRVLMQSMRRAA